MTPNTDNHRLNRRVCADFCFWLQQGGYSPSARRLYSAAVRFALGFLDPSIAAERYSGQRLPVKQFQPEHLIQVQGYLAICALAPSTRAGYRKGLNKFWEFLRFPKPDGDVNWDGYLKDMPPDLAASLRRYVTQRARSWRNADHLRRTRSLLSQLCAFFHSAHLTCVQDITSKTWFAYVATRLKENIQPSSLNTTLRILRSFLKYLQSEERKICERMLEVRPLKTGQSLPRDLPIEQVKALLTVIDNDLDRAWFLLMLHSGLRTCEIRTVRLSDVDLSQQTIHIRESKNQRERVAYLSLPAVTAIQAYLANRDNSSEYLFSRHHKPLSSHYCQSRLKTLGKKVNIHVTPHQLRHYVECWIMVSV